MKPHQQRLKDLIKSLKEASNGELRKPALEAVGAEMLARVKMGFQRSRDPYGDPWAPLKTRQGQILVNHSILRNSFGVLHLNELEVTVGSNISYGKFQQEGFKTRAKRSFFSKRTRQGVMPWVPPRPMLPDERGLPESWRDSIRKLLVKLFKDRVHL